MMMTRFEFKKFQREDLARGALHPGLILAWATGLGKTLAMFSWPILKVSLAPGVSSPKSSVPTPSAASTRLKTLDLRPETPFTNRLVPARPVLLVVPGDGHDQTDDESRKHFKTVATRLDSQATFLRLSTVNQGRRELPPGYYLTSYTQLSQNGVAKFPEFTSTLTLADLFLAEADAESWWNERGTRYSSHYARLGATPLTPWSAMQAADGKLKFNRDYRADDLEALSHVTPIRTRLTGPTWSDLSEAQREFSRGELIRSRHRQCREGIGETRNGIKCVYSASLSDLGQDSFAVIVVDEGTKLQGEETLISLGCRQIRADFRLVLSATPIKNRLPQVFRLAHFACGSHEQPTARFPYGNASENREDFAQKFQVGETSEKPDARGRVSRRRKLTPQIANVHEAWKLFAPIILRRRKEDCGEDIAIKRRHVVRVPLGTIQAQVYAFHLKAKYTMKDSQGREKSNIGARLQALRIVAANPNSPLLTDPECLESGVSSLKSCGPTSTGLQTLGFRPETAGRKVFSPYSYIPKVASVLEVIRGVLERREQILIGSAFNSSLDALSARLSEAGLPHLVLDGRTSQTRRGQLARQFKIGSPRSVLEGFTQRHSPFPIVLAGVESMAELHSFPYVNNVGLLSYSWAYDKFEQFINRVHRLNSPWPVDVWSVICEGSVDRVLEASVHTKGDASDLVLDGHLLGENPSEVNLHELLATALKEFSHNAKTFDEPTLERDWPRLRKALAAAYQGWSASGPVQSPKSKVQSPSEASQRLETLDIGLETSLVRLPTPPPTPIIGRRPPPPQRAVGDLPLWRQRRKRD